MKLVLTIGLLMVVYSGWSQYTTTKKMFTEHFQNGNLKSYKTITEKKTKVPKLHEFYLRKDTKQTSFYEAGGPFLFVRTINKKGTYGRYCNEILLKQVEYHPNGQIKSVRKSMCDCLRQVNKTYNESGKLLTRERTKNRWIRRKDG